jgi:DNA-directed RNA polymerase subunit RPC12/RpoP
MNSEIKIKCKGCGETYIAAKPSKSQSIEVCPYCAKPVIIKRKDT